LHFPGDLTRRRAQAVDRAGAGVNQRALNPVLFENRDGAIACVALGGGVCIAGSSPCLPGNLEWNFAPGIV
jgi:hypothetical protein